MNREVEVYEWVKTGDEWEKVSIRRGSNEKKMYC